MKYFLTSNLTNFQSVLRFVQTLNRNSESAKTEDFEEKNILSLELGSAIAIKYDDKDSDVDDSCVLFSKINKLEVNNSSTHGDFSNLKMRTKLVH